MTQHAEIPLKREKVAATPWLKLLAMANSHLDLKTCFSTSKELRKLWIFTVSLNRLWRFVFQSRGSQNVTLVVVNFMSKWRRLVVM